MEWTYIRKTPVVEPVQFVRIVTIDLVTESVSTVCLYTPDWIHKFLFDFPSFLILWFFQVLVYCVVFYRNLVKVLVTRFQSPVGLFSRVPLKSFMFQLFSRVYDSSLGSGSSRSSGFSTLYGILQTLQILQNFKFFFFSVFSIRGSLLRVHVRVSSLSS